MPDRNQLKPGDLIRLLGVPAGDLKQRERELSEGGHEEPGWTADTIERILLIDPVVKIDHIDEFGHPWFDYELIDETGETEFHSIAIMDDDSWEFA